MKKKISVILTKNQNNLGEKGTITTVALGYAFNYLIPNYLAKIASTKTIKHIEMLQKIEQNKNSMYQLEAEKLKKYLETIKKINIHKKTGENYTFFGNINEKEVLKILLQNTGKTFNKKQINYENIKQIGTFKLNINIFNNITCTLKINIVPENI